MATTAGGRPAWIVTGITRSGGSIFLVTRLSDTAYASALHWCGDSCGPFPLAHARRLLAHLAPMPIKMSLARWIGTANGQYRTLRIAFDGRGCDLKTRFTDPTSRYSIGERVLATTLISDFAPLCRTGQVP